MILFTVIHLSQSVNSISCYFSGMHFWILIYFVLQPMGSNVLSACIVCFHGQASMTVSANV